jgi:hypothetical protein
LPSEEEWLKVIGELEGRQKDAAVIRARGYHLLKEVNEAKATPERAGWLNLWAKTLVALESAISAFQYRSDLFLQIISRSTAEWILHVLVLIDPICDLMALEQSNRKVLISSRSREYSLKQTVDRLRAYAAWCLWSDKVYYKELIHPETLAGTWDPSPAKEILADDKARELYERFFGRLESETDEKILRERRKKMERVFSKKIDRIDEWLSDPHLKPWSNKILELSKKKRGGVTFFTLFDPEATISKRLQKHGLRFGYAMYSESSMLLHGSTMEKFIVIGDSFLAPKLQTDASEAESTFVKVISDCNSLFFKLGLINHFVLKRPELRR